MIIVKHNITVTKIIGKEYRNILTMWTRWDTVFNGIENVGNRIEKTQKKMLDGCDYTC